jgi:hypothetical protein
MIDFPVPGLISGVTLGLSWNLRRRTLTSVMVCQSYVFKSTKNDYRLEITPKLIPSLSAQSLSPAPIPSDTYASNSGFYVKLIIWGGGTYDTDTTPWNSASGTYVPQWPGLSNPPSTGKPASTPLVQASINPLPSRALRIPGCSTSTTDMTWNSRHRGYTHTTHQVSSCPPWIAGFPSPEGTSRAATTV